MKHIGVCIACRLMIASMTVAAIPARAEPAPACAVSGHSVDEAGLVRIGRIAQWVTAEGRNCSNPVVLIVHGGPGNPNTPFARNLFGSWTKNFTVVQWDQRGSGKTYAASKPGEDEALTLEGLTRDGIEVARYAAARFGKRRVIIMGGSWGSALATSMALAAPDLFDAYVGTAQLVNYQADLSASYRHALALARRDADTNILAGLEKIGPPPWTDPRAFGVLRRITRKFEAKMTEPAPEGWFSFAPGYDTPAYRQAYEAGEDYSFLQVVGMKGDGMGPKIDLPKLGTRFAMPVYMLQGEQDLVTPIAVSRAYFDTISAPRKQFIRLPRTGHDPNPTMITAQLEVLNQIRVNTLKADRR